MHEDRQICHLTERENEPADNAIPQGGRPDGIWRRLQHSVGQSGGAQRLLKEERLDKVMSLDDFARCVIGPQSSAF